MTKTLAIAREAAGFVGAAIVAVGAGMIYLPAGVIIGGLMLIGLAVAPLKAS